MPYQYLPWMMERAEHVLAAMRNRKAVDRSGWTSGLGHWGWAAKLPAGLLPLPRSALVERPSSWEGVVHARP